MDLTGEGRPGDAAGNNTACVFHLMRAAEHGLRALVTAVGVTTPKIPLEYQEWQNLIEQVEKHADVINSWAQPSKSNARAFFNGVIADFYAFKDDIRNILMHTRAGGTYDEAEAHHEIQRVSKCLCRLADNNVAEGVATSVLNASLFI